MDNSQPRQISRPCTQAQLQSDSFQAWASRMHERPMHMHRKIWEFCYITQALYERGMLAPDKRGLGFAVGQEPLPSLFATHGCEILATDLGIDAAQNSAWIETNQHADSLELLNQRELCDPQEFQELVTLRYVDMRDLPDDLGQFDFVWSACAMEHLGSLAFGERFVLESLKYLKPGGIAIHTTEYNVESNIRTVTRGDSVIYRKRDIKRIARKLARRRYHVDLVFDTGSLPFDAIVDRPPYQHQNSLKVEVGGMVATSYGLIIEEIK